MQDEQLRELVTKRAFVGYNKEDVLKKMELIQEEHNEEHHQLIQKLYETQNKNIGLKKQITDAINKYENKSNRNPIVEELSNVLMTVYIEQSKAIHSFKSDLEMKEFETKRMIESKQQKIDEAKKRVKETMDYLRSLQNDTTHSKELKYYYER